MEENQRLKTQKGARNKNPNSLDMPPTRKTREGSQKPFFLPQTLRRLGSLFSRNPRSPKRPPPKRPPSAISPTTTSPTTTSPTTTSPTTISPTIISPPTVLRSKRPPIKDFISPLPTELLHYILEYVYSNQRLDIDDDFPISQPIFCNYSFDLATISRRFFPLVRYIMLYEVRIFPKDDFSPIRLLLGDALPGFNFPNCKRHIHRVVVYLPEAEKAKGDWESAMEFLRLLPALTSLAFGRRFGDRREAPIGLSLPERLGIWENLKEVILDLKDFGALQSLRWVGALGSVERLWLTGILTFRSTSNRRGDHGRQLEVGGQPQDFTRLPMMKHLQRLRVDINDCDPEALSWLFPLSSSPAMVGWGLTSLSIDIPRTGRTFDRYHPIIRIYSHCLQRLEIRWSIHCALLPDSMPRLKFLKVDLSMECLSTLSNMFTNRRTFRKGYPNLERLEVVYSTPIQRSRRRAPNKLEFPRKLKYIQFQFDPYRWFNNSFYLSKRFFPPGMFPSDPSTPALFAARSANGMSLFPPKPRAPGSPLPAPLVFNISSLHLHWDFACNDNGFFKQLKDPLINLRTLAVTSPWLASQDEETEALDFKLLFWDAKTLTPNLVHLAFVCKRFSKFPYDLPIPSEACLGDAVTEKFSNQLEVVVFSMRCMRSRTRSSKDRRAQDDSSSHTSREVEGDTKPPKYQYMEYHDWEEMWNSWNMQD